MNWQLIETAPKDGSHVLVTRYPFTGRSAPYKIAWWSEGEMRRHYKPWKISFRVKLRWAPTHWMPLPEPPKDKP